MIDPKKCQQSIDELAKKLAEAIPTTVQQVKQDMQQTFHTILQAAFAKLDLVTREEFDTQVAVLAKTRAKLENLEQTVSILETKAGLHKPNVDAREND